MHHSPQMSTVVGVDGCRAGWIAVTSSAGALTFGIFASMRELLDHHHDANLILVDIPIGLPSKGTPSRPCDTAARLLLGRRRSSVFSAPSRFASRALDIADARQRNIAELGKSLSAQAHAICLKIAEVDQLLLTDHSLRNRVREVHPEVCFWALNGRAPLQHAKKERAGVGRNALDC
jgi:predicted RNase H-like nuclease